MKTNVAEKTQAPRTHEGAPAARITPTQSLRRLVMSCLLFEDQFYIDGQSAADMIHAAADLVPVTELADLAVEARTHFNLRHVPLWLLVKLIERARGHGLVSDTIAKVVQRADEPGELLALYWKGGKKPLAKQLQKGLAKAISGFDAYQLAKYDRDAAVKLRDVLFLSHAKPVGADKEALFKQMAERSLPVPDTWEVALSGGADKKETFTRLLAEGKLGYLALLRNLRNMDQSGVDRDLVTGAILARKGAHRVLPFRYVAAARAAPSFEPALDQALTESISEARPLSGKTAVLVDVSGSMDFHLSGKSDLRRMDAAATLASVLPGDVRVWSFSDDAKEVPARKGMAGVEAIIRSQPHHGTWIDRAVAHVDSKGSFERMIVITDEQSHDHVSAPVNSARAYMINVGAYRNGVGYGPWVHIDGFSEHVIRFISECENDSIRTA